MPSHRAIPVLALSAALAATAPAHAQSRPSVVLSNAKDLLLSPPGIPSSPLPTPPQSTPDPATLFAQATTALQSNDYTSAESLFRQVAALDYTAAAVTLRQAVALAPSSTQARYLLGLACFFSDDFAGTLAALQPLWSAESTNLRFLYVLASAAGREHQAALEQGALAQMSTVGAGTAELHLYLGKAMLTKGDAAAALPELQQAVVLDPHLPLAHFFLAEALHQQHHDAAAVAALHTEISLEPELAFPYDELGTLDDLLGDTPGASAAFHAALDRDPALSSSLLGLAAIDRRQGQLPEALTLLTRAEALRPGSGSIHFLRAQLLRQLGQGREARTEFAQAATLLHQVNDNLQHTDSAAQQADATQAAAGAQL